MEDVKNATVQGDMQEPLAPEAKKSEGTPWTTAQENAIKDSGRTLLVSAAAGSGKTAVLTERIVRMIADEKSGGITRMLIVTFTKAAAAEMKHRIEKKLAERLEKDLGNQHLARQLMLLGSASISTIDSFYYDIVRQNFEQAGLPASFRIVDTAELVALRTDLMNETVDEMYREEPLFAQLADLLSEVRTEEKLTKSLLLISTSLLRNPDGVDFLLRAADEIEKSCDNVLDTTFGKSYAREVQRLASEGVAIFNAFFAALPEEKNREKIENKYGAAYTLCMEHCQRVLDGLAANDYAAVQQALCVEIPGTGSGTPGQSPEFGVLRKTAAKLCEVWNKLAPALSAFSEAEIRESATRTAALLRVLHQTLTRFKAAYRDAKLQREMVEFSDVSRAAYRLLVDKDGNPTPIARQIADSYDAVFIDEYQDVDAMQDATFRAVSKPNNRFMVGDIKQSIYRFRGADPSVFAGYRRALSPLETVKKTGGDSAMIFMSDCFRCDKNVIDFTNTVFHSLFGSVADSIGYSREDDLVYSKKAEDSGKEPCRVLLADSKGKGGTAQSRVVANEIRRLVGHERLANGKKIRYADIAILVRSTTICDELVACLSAYGIPVNDSSQKRFFENPDVLCVYSLLASLDNPQNDVYLAATLRSPFFGFTLEDLVRIRHGTDRSLSLFDTVMAYNGEENEPLTARVTDFRARFSAWRARATREPVDRLLRYLYRETAILSFAGNADSDLDDSDERRANLQRLYEYARTFEAGSFKGLYQFVRYVEGIMESNLKMPALQGKANAVSIFTIHGSKGLERPVCFLLNTDASFNKKDEQQQFLQDADLGCALRLPNVGAFSRCNTFFRETILRSISAKNREEEMRLLYVALTRARERLYVVARNSKDVLKNAEQAASSPLPDLYTRSASSYIAWILAALYRDPDHEHYTEIEVVNADELPERLTATPKEDAESTSDTHVCDVLRERFDYRYPYARLARLPAKLSVSRLSPGVLDVYDTDATSPDTLQSVDVERLLHTFERVPTFGGEVAEADAAARGSATHEFLQFCRFDAVERHGVAAELDYLIGECYLPPETRELVRIDELERFFASDFYNTLRRAKRVHRETRFHVFLPAERFATDSFAEHVKGEKLAVQGVIDLFFYDENDDIVLCDYKTDRLSAAELRDPTLATQKLAERHAQQLSYYAHAIREICGKAPEKILIYSLPLGMALEIPTIKENGI